MNMTTFYKYRAKSRYIHPARRPPHTADRCQSAVEQADLSPTDCKRFRCKLVETALALDLTSYFVRKQLFYSDVLAGYQITQQRLPLARARGEHLEFKELESRLPG